MLEQFAKLNAKTISVKGNGTAPLLDISDLCGVLASLEDHHSWYIYAMIEQRRAYNMELLHKYFQHIIIQEMRERKYKSKLVGIAEFSDGVTRAALYSHFNPKSKCDACAGIGFKAAKKCEKCSGKGHKGHNWSDKVVYGFPLRKDLTRKWYAQCCAYYDNLISSLIVEIEYQLVEKMKKIKRQALDYQSEQECLFDD